MKKSILFLFAVLLILPFCTVTDSEEDNTPSVDIKDQIAQGKISATEPFMLKTALCKYGELFAGKKVYIFYLHDTVMTCDNPEYKYPPIKFTLDTLKVGTLEGDGPYINSSSFFGCDVILTKVTDAIVEGRVKGGNVTSNEYVEGSFSATICK